MHDDWDRTVYRARRALENRLQKRIWAQQVPCDVSAYVPAAPVPVADALAAGYTPVQPGEPWGLPWSTTWFKVTGCPPEGWAGGRVEAMVDLGFTNQTPGFQAEGLAFAPDGTPIKGVMPLNHWLPVVSQGSGTWTAYVEAVAMPAVIGERGREDRYEPTGLGDVRTAGGKPLYKVGEAKLVLVDEAAWGLVFDFDVLLGVATQLGPGSPRGHEVIRALERALDAYDLDPSAETARAALKDVLASPAARTAHRISAVGHAHIDSAWLWPVRETVRKCARTFANVAALGEAYPELVFACSQAQQWWWAKQHYPAIYARMEAQVAKGQVVPVGGMWVESDTNVTGAEALARQLVFGKRFFLDELGVETDEVWLPDCFGYSAALPQLIALSGSHYFLTQKISWNETNRFPHHTFWWEGIDGTRVFTHFPPVDTYNSDMSPAQMSYAAANYSEVGLASRSLVPFGYGDGGGGPTREMMERARRMADLDGAPQVSVDSPAKFFAAARAEYPDAPVWSGELYLELHRATLTSQVGIKQGNRRSEHLAREAELWSATAAAAGLLGYPYAELDDIWRDILLNQFHDILPGSSIAMVNDEAIASHASIAARLEALTANALSALGSGGEAPLAFNAAPHERAGVPALGATAPLVSTDAASVTVAAGGTVLQNGRLRVELDSDGHIASLLDLEAGREVLPPGTRANVLQLHPDYPNKYPAWDVDSFYRRRKVDIGSPAAVAVVSDGPGEAAVRLEYAFGSSRAVQVLRLTAGSDVLVLETEVDWQEEDRFLKVAFPVDVHADWSSAEIQFGHVRRPTHTNTSWDAARFEIVAHRFLHIGEPGYGVAIVNGGIYGHDVTTIEREGGGRATVARLSLVRGPTFPDPRADRGTHHFRYAIVPGASIADAVREGYRFNLPLRAGRGKGPVAPLVSVDNPAVVVEAVKMADDRSGDVVVRCYEALGGRATATVRTSFPLARAGLTDLLERPLEDLGAGGQQLDLSLRPFQVVTLRLSPRT